MLISLGHAVFLFLREQIQTGQILFVENVEFFFLTSGLGRPLKGKNGRKWMGVRPTLNSRWQ